MTRAIRERQRVLGADLDEVRWLVNNFRRLVIPNQTTQAAALKVQQEAKELADSPDDIVEAADVLITLLGWCAARDLPIEMVIDAAEAKMRTNLDRKWNINADGTAQHAE